MTQVFLIRHANAYDEFGFQEPETPLRGPGPEQAQKLAERLNNFAIDVAYASPYARAQETANAFSKLSGTAIITDNNLKEIGTDEWTEKDFTKAKESVEDVLLAILSKNKDKNIALFTHGNFIRTTVCLILKSKLSAYNNNIAISLASITTIQTEDLLNFKLIAVSDNAHEQLL